MPLPAPNPGASGPDPDGRTHRKLVLQVWLWLLGGGALRLGTWSTGPSLLRSRPRPQPHLVSSALGSAVRCSLSFSLLTNIPGGRIFASVSAGPPILPTHRDPKSPLWQNVV